MYERMRNLDAMNAWASDTIKTYSSLFQKLIRFQNKFRVPVLIPGKLEEPPRTQAIPLGWAQLDYSLKKGKQGTTTFGRIRALRSAASLFYTWDGQHSNPEQKQRTGKKQPKGGYPSPTKDIVYTLQNKGLARRIGDEPKPSWPLHWKHVKYINDQLEIKYQNATTDAAKHEYAAAGTANLMLWMGWFRGGEHFNLEVKDITLVRPQDGEQYGLDPGIGFVESRLSPETKSSPNKTAEVIMSYRSASGLSVGRWMRRLLQFPSQDGIHLYSTAKKSQWTSGYYMREFLWPLLEQLRATGEPTLMAFSDEKGMRIRDKIWSLHCYRRGGESYVKKKRPENYRRATKEEQYQHARWKCASESIDQRYTEWSREDRICIGLLCL